MKTESEVISDVTTYLYSSDPSQKLSDVKSTGPDDETVKELLEKKLLLGQLKIISDQVTSDTIVRNNTKFVDLLLNCSVNINLSDTSNDINRFMNSLRSNLFNPEFVKQTNISLVRVLIKDSAEKLLVHYIYDVDINSQSWYTAEGIIGDWFPRPPSPNTLASATALRPTSTLVPGRMEVYPPPEVTPTPTPTPIQYP